MKPLSNPQKRIARQLYESGQSRNKIAKRLKVSPNRVQAYIVKIRRNKRILRKHERKVMSLRKAPTTYRPNKERPYVVILSYSQPITTYDEEGATVETSYYNQRIYYANEIKELRAKAKRENYGFTVINSVTKRQVKPESAIRAMRRRESN